MLSIVRLVPSRFSCPRCGLWVGFNEFAVHQGKDGRKLSLFLPPFQKALRALVAFPYNPMLKGINKWPLGHWVRVWSIIKLQGPLKTSVLANDVTLVTSYGYCQSLKINDRRCTYVQCLSYDL